jgi:hypothetical protein
MFCAPISLLALWFVGVGVLLAGCASTTLDGVWTRPELAGKPIQGTVMVVGVARDETVRRVYEDDMVARLAARGVQALRSYAVVPGALDSASAGVLLQQAQAAGAQYLLSTVVIGQEREQVVSQEPWFVGGWGSLGYRAWYAPYWTMAYPVYTEVRIYTIFVAQTALTEVATDRIDWAARTRTTSSTNIERDTRAFVAIIVDSLAKAGLVGNVS